MNEFTAKKLGEVMAFAIVGAETFEKGHVALTSVFGGDMVESTISKCEDHKETISKLAKAHGVEDVVMKKAEGTSRKLRSMRELYVAEQWENATELLEWSGFFEGAAVVHWAIIKGVGESTQDREIISLSDEGSKLHHEILHKASALLLEVGKKKSV